MGYVSSLEGTRDTKYTIFVPENERMFFFPKGTLSTGNFEFRLPTIDFQGILLMVQKSHSQPPGIYRNLVKLCKETTILTRLAGFLNHESSVLDRKNRGNGSWIAPCRPGGMFQIAWIVA